MSIYKITISEIEASGGSILAILGAMQSHRDLGLDYMADKGLVGVVPEGFYPLKKVLSVFKNIEEELGDKTLYVIGKAILDAAQFPPDMDSIDKGLSMIDVAYHMNHKIGGKVLFDASNGQMFEGIGHYLYQKTGSSSGKMICENPYPCEFDRGIITAMACKFKPLAQVVLDTSKESRSQGGKSSTYLISW